MKTNRWLIAIIILMLLVMAAQTWMLWSLRREHQLGKQSADPYRSVAPKNYSQSRQSVSVPSSFTWFSQPSSNARAQKMVMNDPFDQWDPFVEMDQMRVVMNRMFSDSLNRGIHTQGLGDAGAASYSPEVDLRVNENEYLVTVDLPGIEKDKIDIKVKNGQLVLSGQREASGEEAKDNGFYRMERSFGSFLRSFPLPDDASSEGIRADSKNGVLTIHIPRVKSGSGTETKKIQVE